MLIVTHDRYFVNRIADRILVLTQDGLTGFSGDWSAYSASLQEAGAAAQGEAETEAAKQPNAYQRKRELRSAIQRSRGALKRAEERVAAQ